METVKIVGYKKRRYWFLHVDAWDKCQLCPLGRSAINHVLLRGTIPANILFIGEAPGLSEDTIGLPFIGPAGKVLDALIQEATRRLEEFSYAISNIVACVPWTNNGEFRENRIREPSKEEAQACLPRLQELLKLVEPDGVVFLGKFAGTYADSLCMNDRKEVHTKACLLHHPSYILRRGGIKTLEFSHTVQTLSEFISHTVFHKDYKGGEP